MVPIDTITLFPETKQGNSLKEMEIHCGKMEMEIDL